MSRFKVYCPRCEEVYIPKFRSVNIDGAFFGTTFPHHFLKHQKQAVILPPKIYHYEPKIYGFKVQGKRGSKYFDPPLGNVKYNLESMTGVAKEELMKKGQELRSTRFAAAGPFSGEVQSQTQKVINNNFFVTETKDVEMIIAEALKKTPTPQTITEEGNKKNKNKNKKK